MIELINVTKKYGKLLANDNISFTVEPGEISILAGPNGAGKSTLIKSIAGLLRFQGKILVNGWENKSIEAKKSLGYIPEAPVLYDMLTTWEHVEFIARAYSLNDWEDYANTLFERFELVDKKDKLGNELSKGMQQKISICCALLPKPKVVLLDEPFVGLDPHAIKELKKMIVELKEERVAILISTHMLDSVTDYWDSTNILVKGKIAASRTREDIHGSDEDLEELFFEVTENTNNSVVGG